MDPEPQPDGHIYTLGLLEQLRDNLRQYGHANDDLYFRIDKLLRELPIPTCMRWIWRTPFALSSGTGMAGTTCA
jgi:hypothetical protein